VSHLPPKRSATAAEMAQILEMESRFDAIRALRRDDSVQLTVEDERMFAAYIDHCIEQAQAIVDAMWEGAP
jgi:hypothetical protein